MNLRRVLQLAAALVFALARGAAAFADVVINEIHYDPPVKTELAEFIELHNSGAESVDLSGWEFTDGIQFTFPAGTLLPSGGYIVVAENPAGLQAKFGVSALGPWSGLLANDGETVTLRNAAGQVMDRVVYKLGFPWPTLGDPPGYSMELVNPSFDNDLGGSWRRSVKGNPNATTQVLIPAGSVWRYREGTQEASSPATLWRQLSYDDGSWPEGAAPIGYDPSLPMGTPLDMRGNYTAVFLRRTFFVDAPDQIGSLKLFAMYDDGFKVWINGQHALDVNISTGEVAFNGTAGPARESSAFDEFTIAPGLLRQGENSIAIQLHNSHISNSSDCYLDIRLEAEFGSPGAGPTPGARNAVYDTNIPPHIRQVNHSPAQPAAGQPVRISAKITDPDGVASVRLFYQLVDPGNYIELSDAAYESSWTAVNMVDDGTAGDLVAGDDTFTVTLPGSLQTHRRLVRYRIEASDSGDRSIRAPYLEDPAPNFAYFVYNGVPAWQGAVRPGVTPAQTISAEEMGRLPTYHLIAKRSAVEDATWNSRYTGDLYRWWGTLVYAGKVYDHIRYRARGGVWRYAMGKNMWKFDFNRGHDFQARDNYGKEYKAKWRKLNLGANIQQGDYDHRGEQGMFESVGFRLFNMAGVESPKTHWINYRVIDDAQEAPPNNQYAGDFWGLYLAVEQQDGRFLDEHDLPDGNLYKMENYTGDLNNQGRYSATDESDLNLFLSTYRNSSNPPTEAWWRQNMDLSKLYSYHSIVEAIHHYDICFGKNYFYYLNPVTGHWSIHAWDLDLTWADNMYGASCDDIRDRVITRSPFDIEYRNRVREIRDLLYNTDQAWTLIDEYANIVKGTNSGPNILAADQSMWDYNPIMNNSGIVNLSKAGQGRFYQFPRESASNPSRRGSFEAAVLIMKDYVVKRAALLDNLAADPAIPATPSASYAGPQGFPVNRIDLSSSSFSGSAPFAAMKWRVGEIRSATPGISGRYEIESAWESPEITAFSSEYTIPAEALKVGHTYRARVQMKDSTGRWSHWSVPIEFTAAEPDNSAALREHLKISEIMYNPPAGSDFEFIEIYNSSTNITLQLGGVSFTDGIEFTFPSTAFLSPREYGLVVQGNPAGNFGIFGAYYNLGAASKLFGPYSGNLNNDGERLTLKTALAGEEILSFTFDDGPGWPIAGDGTGHSIVHSGGSYQYGGNWRAGSFIGGSPLDGAESAGEVPVINEFAAHTDYADPARPEYDSNDWIEIYNPGVFNLAVDLGDYYLSDDASNLGKWRLPNMRLSPGERATFDEVTHFHNPITSGFGLNKAGEELYLTRFGPEEPVQVVDAIRFSGQENDFTFGRYPDGGPYFYTLVPTRDAANILALTTFIVSEVMYHPQEDSEIVEQPWREFVEIHNTTGTTLDLFNSNGPYRVRGGLSFNFSPGISIPPDGTLLLVSFDPSNVSDLGRFKTFYNIDSPNILFSGPFTGRLGNSSDRIALEKPEAPDLPGDPVVWVIVDEVIYTDASGADGSGESLHRVASNRSGNDPSNFIPDAPSPGRVPAISGDRDGDGLPDEWELAYGLNPDDPSDATLDLDADGLSNLAEFQAGTDPTSSASRLAVEIVKQGEATALSIKVVAGRTYSVFYCTDLNSGTWLKLQDFSGSESVTVTDKSPSNQQRYYRVVTPAQP